MGMHYADVLVHHPYSRKQESLTYVIPDEMRLAPGNGVSVPFHNKNYPGLVLRVHEAAPVFKTKNIHGILESASLLFPWQIQMAEWISEYYFCSLWEAVRLFLPKNIFRIPKRKMTKKNKKFIQKEDRAHSLSDEQKTIVRTLLEKRPAVSLIQGVTGSGKTEVYKHLIKKVIQEGKQCILLVPEISLTPQFLAYFEADFPELAVLHSRISEGNKAELWRRIREGHIPLIIGSRSALFAPTPSLGLILMDEEHEWSYKQDQSPRYHARDVALKIAESQKAMLVLGSATPSIESRYQASLGRYDFFELTERIGKTPLPQVNVVDMRDELKRGNFTPISEDLEQKIRSTLERKEQVLLFLNRRGFASSTLCRDCGYVCRCTECEVPLTYHARNFYRPTLICHHCGKTSPVPVTCPQCDGVRIKQLGSGTERIEEELKRLFPSARVARADKDTMSKKDSFSKLHSALNNQEVDILLGTQMIGKGWDIPNLSLVGILLADLGMNIPDFRASERIFDLLTQVSGRAGRRKNQGEVILQTYNPETPLIQFSKNHDVNGFYEQEIDSRKAAGLPPFGKLIKITVRSDSASEAQKKALELKTKLQIPDHAIFAAPAFLTHYKGKFIWNLLIQGPAPEAALARLTLGEREGLIVDRDPMVCI